MNSQLNTIRHPWMAAFLSILMPGLGQLYCGATMRCLWIAGIMGILGLLMVIPLFIIQGDGHDRLLFIFSLTAVALYGLNIFDSLSTARQTRADYRLKDYNRWYAYLLFYLAVSGGYLFICLCFRENLSQLFQVGASGMYPTLNSGDIILTDKTLYRDRDPEAGDVIVFPSPDNRMEYIVKRVVAVGGDTVEIRDDELYVNDVKLNRTEDSSHKSESGSIKQDGKYLYEWNKGKKYSIFLSTSTDSRMPNFPRTLIPKYSCFVLGDNRDNSLDSRIFGPIPIVGINGKADFIVVPSQSWSKFGTLDLQK